MLVGRDIKNDAPLWYSAFSEPIKSRVPSMLTKLPLASGSSVTPVPTLPMSPWA